MTGYERSILERLSCSQASWQKLNTSPSTLLYKGHHYMGSGALCETGKQLNCKWFQLSFMFYTASQLLWKRGFIFSHKLCICSFVLLCLLSPGELTLIPHLLLTDNTNYSLTSLPPPKQFMTTMIISLQQRYLKASQQPTGIVVESIYTSVSVH